MFPRTQIAALRRLHRLYLPVTLIALGVVVLTQHLMNGITFVAGGVLIVAAVLALLELRYLDAEGPA